MGKIIIDNKSNILTDQDACRLVIKVIGEGSVSNNNKQYCYLTSFSYGVSMERYCVATDLNKKSDRFIVYDDK